MSASRLLLVGLLASLLLALGASAVSPLPAAGTTARAGQPRILLDCRETYSILPDGSRLTPVVRRELRMRPLALSRDGSTVVYTRESSDTLYVSRTNGAALRQLGRNFGGPLGLSRDGRLLALPQKAGIWIIGTNGRGLRRLTSGRDDGWPDWSPDGKALVFLGGSTQNRVILQPLHGKQRLLARGTATPPRWSPDGRWIAYGHSGLWLVRPDGSQRHRLATGVSDFAWAPGGKRLAVAGYSQRHGHRLGLIGVDGRGLKWLRLTASPATGYSPSWSPDGRRIAFTGQAQGYASQVWVVGDGGRGLRRLTTGCDVLGWTRLAPLLPPDPPLERVLGPTMVATRDPIVDLSADESQVAFFAQSSPVRCGHIDVWTPGTSTIPGLATCASGYGLELAGTRLAWASIEGCGNFCEVSVLTATLAKPKPVSICYLCGNYNASEAHWDFHLRGDGDLLVFNDSSRDVTRLVGVGGGSERCKQGEPRSPAICTTLRRGEHAGPIESVSAGLIAIRESDEVAVLDRQGALVRQFPFLPDEVTSARLDGGRLVVARLAVIDVYDVATGARVSSLPRPRGFELSDVDGGIALLRHEETMMLLRLADGRSRTLDTGRGPRLGELEAPGLYFSYSTGAEGRIVFIPREDLFDALALALQRALRWRWRALKQKVGGASSDAPPRPATRPRAREALRAGPRTARP